MLKDIMYGVKVFIQLVLRLKTPEELVHQDMERYAKRMFERGEPLMGENVKLEGNFIPAVYHTPIHSGSAKWHAGDIQNAYVGCVDVHIAGGGGAIDVTSHGDSEQTFIPTHMKNKPKEPEPPFEFKKGISASEG